MTKWEAMKQQLYSVAVIVIALYTLHWVASCTVSLCNHSKTAIAEACFTAESDTSQSACRCSFLTVVELMLTEIGKPFCTV